MREKVEKYLIEEAKGPPTTSSTDDDYDYYDYYDYYGRYTGPRVYGPPGAKCLGDYNDCNNYDDYGYYYSMRGPSTPKPVHPETVTYTFAPTDQTPYWGGYYRDPHVVLPLKLGVNLCFDWDGKDGEVGFQFLYVHYIIIFSDYKVLLNLLNKELVQTIINLLSNYLSMTGTYF